MPILDSAYICGLGVKETCDCSVTALMESSNLGNGTHQLWFQHPSILHKDRLLPDTVVMVVGWQNDSCVCRNAQEGSEQPGCQTPMVSMCWNDHETTATDSG